MFCKGNGIRRKMSKKEKRNPEKKKYCIEETKEEGKHFHSNNQSLSSELGSQKSKYYAKRG